MTYLCGTWLSILCMIMWLLWRDNKGQPVGGTAPHASTEIPAAGKTAPEAGAGDAAKGAGNAESAEDEDAATADV